MNELYLIKGNSFGGSSMYTCVLSYGFLKDKTEVPIYDPQTKIGYQRKSKPSRVKAIFSKLVTYFKNPSPLIDSINLNIRNNQLEKTQLTLIDGDGGPGSLYKMMWPDGDSIKDKFQIVDGQTRFNGVESTYKEYEKNNNHKMMYKVDQLTFSVNLTFLDAIWDEAYIFISINKNAKKVDTSLGERVIHEADLSGNVLFQNEIKGDKKYIHRRSCNNISDKLAGSSVNWGWPRIKDANEEKVPSPNVTFEAMSRFIEPVFLALKEFKENKTNKEIKSQSDIHKLETETLASIDAFWDAVFEIYSNIPGNESKYSIQKSSLTEVLFNVHAGIILHPHVSMSNYNRFKKDDYVKLLRKPLESSATLKEKNGNGKSVSGEDFWLSGDDGAAGKYTSSAAKKELTDNIYKEIITTKP
tara:strand:+ start:1705 stop:2943 length:1239 start_codon:yes stop_codon:yes gene_type:complete